MTWFFCAALAGGAAVGCSSETAVGYTDITGAVEGVVPGPEPLVRATNPNDEAVGDANLEVAARSVDFRGVATRHYLNPIPDARHSDVTNRYTVTVYVFGSSTDADAFQDRYLHLHGPASGGRFGSDGVVGGEAHGPADVVWRSDNVMVDVWGAMVGPVGKGGDQLGFTGPPEDLTAVADAVAAKSGK